MSDADPREGRHAQRPLTPRAIGVIVVATLLSLLLLATGLLWASRASSRARVDELSVTLAHQLDTYRRQRWARPPLGTPPVDGNAWDAIRTATNGLPQPPPHDVQALVERGAPAPDALMAFAAAHAGALDSLGASTRRTWSWAASGGRFPFEQPPLLPVLRAARARLAVTQGAPAVQCLVAGEQTVRVGQDVAAGGGLVGLQIGAVLVEQAVPVLVRCAARATPDERTAARSALEMLASHPPPAGAAMQLETLLLCAGALDAAYRVPLLPLPGEYLAAWRIGRDALAASATICRTPSAWGALTYPRLLTAIEHEQASRAASSNQYLSLAAPDYARFFARDASAQAKLRALVVALAEQAGVAASAPSRVDPYTGGALRVERARSEISVRSVGPNRRDERGAGDDVVVRVSAPSATP